MLSTVCPRLGGRTLVLALCECLGDPAREVRYWAGPCKGNAGATHNGRGVGYMDYGVADHQLRIDRGATGAAVERFSA